MIRGAHARNQARITDEDIYRGHLAGFEGYVFMHYMGPLAAEGLGADPAKCIVRLPDTIYKTWPTGAEYIPHWSQYARDCADIVHTYRQEGFRHFQVDNEPNLTWPAHNKGPWDWAWFIDKAIFDPHEGLMARLGAEGIEDIELGFTPFSHPDLHPEWLRASREKGLFQRMSWVAAHCYWQAPTDMYAEAFGSNFAWLHRQTGEKPVYITECGNSMCQSPAYPSRITLSQIRTRQAAEYPEYLRWTSRYPYVRGTYFYILGHNGDWEGFDLTDGVCRAINISRGGGGGSGTPKAM